MVASPTMAAAGTSKSGAAGTRHEMAGVVLLTLALLLGLSLLSYSPRDPILFEESFHPESVQNLIGQVGMTLATGVIRSEEHTSELQSLAYLVCRLLLEKKKNTSTRQNSGALAQHEDSNV